MNQQEKDIQDVLDQLSILAPTEKEAPRPTGQALAQIRQQLDQQQQGRLLNRLSRFLAAANRQLAVGATFLFLVAIFFSFPAVRAAASDFLGLFRVQKFAAISVSPEQIAILQRVAEEGLTPGEMEILQAPGDPNPVSTLEEASSITGWEVHGLTGLGTPQEIYVGEGSHGRLTIDLAGSRAILAASGVDPTLLPDSLDGQQVQVTTFATVEQHWPDGTWLLQTGSPIVTYPDGLDPVVLGQAYLQVLGMQEAEAQRLAQSIDWTSTLLLPVPRDLASFNEVTVNGQSSLALSSLDGQHRIILWQQAGVVYLLSGTGSLAELVSLANTLP